MTTIMALSPQWMDPIHLLSGSGPFGAAVMPVIFAMIFIESGLLFPFLPGDSLLFTAGLLAKQPDSFAPLWEVMLIVPIAAILGDQVGYWIGHTFRPSLRHRPDGKIFKREYLTQTEEFFAKYGPITIIICRFVPIVRTYAPLVAGMVGMRWATFITYNIIGGVLWGSGVVYLGSLFGDIPFVRNNIEAIFLGIVAFTIVPGLIGVYKSWKSKKATNAPADNAEADNAGVDSTGAEEITP